MEEVKIRQAVRTDSPAIFKLLRELSEYKNQQDTFTTKVQDLEHDGFDNDPPYFSTIVAETHKDKKPGDIIGIAMYHLKYSTWEGQVLHLNTFIISEKFRKQGVGRKLMKRLAKIAVDKKYTRISLETSGTNEEALKFFEKLGASNLTKDEGWLNYDFSPESVKTMLEEAKESENVTIRSTEPKDCVPIRDMIQELAVFEKMPDGPKIGVKELQRDGFYKLFPAFYSFVAEFTDPESEEVEVIGYIIFFLTYDFLQGKKIHLEDLYVTPKHRTKGVGEMLFKALAKYAAEGKYSGFTLEVLDWNSKAIQFYDKFGGTNMTSSSKTLQSLRFRVDPIKALSS